MGDRKFTFIELHLDGDTQFGPKAIDSALPIGESGTDEELESESDEDAAAVADEESGGKGAIGAVIALVVLVGIAVAAKKFTGDDETEEQEFEEEPDVIVS
ncbi:hypothetical protein ACFO5R_15725 [Halosolutus amylolyticus]|uniref:PGF-CTERM sorting domain-containing protein n=1 Tax=Halosolutus amylolyticus TaxID=2932267 RepID=A0ABD5PS61_9EURY|nr:hypothetical protein [Halosolutus amylolyticus]